MRFLSILCLLSFPAVLLPGQQLFVQHYPAEIYRGATQNWEMDQDEEGTLYFANNDGVLTYNGKDWNILSMPSKDFVFSVAHHPDGKIYVASYNEIGYFEKDKSASYQYHSLRDKLPEEHRDFKDMNRVVVWEGMVFFTLHSHVHVWADHAFETLNITGRAFKHGDKLYFINADGFYLFQNKSVVAADFNTDLKGLNFKWIDSYLENSLLILDNQDQFWQLNPEAEEGKRLSPAFQKINPWLKQYTTYRLRALTNGNLALLSADELLIINRDGEPVYSFSKNIIGEDFRFRILCEDRHHNLWFTTNASILQVITSSPVSYYDRHNGLNGKVLALGKQGNHHYVGTNAGIFYKENKTTFRMLPETEGEAWNFYNFGNKIFAAHRTGVFELKGKEAKRLVTQRFVHSLCELRNKPDRMIMGTYNAGIWLLRKKQNEWVKTRIKGFDEETRFMLEDDDENIWVSHYNKGIFKLRLNEAMDTVIDQAFYDSNNGLPSNLNNRVFKLHNQMVVTTVDGIYRYNKAKDVFEADSRFNAVLEKNFCIYTLTENESGDIYFWAGVSQNRELAGALQKQRDGSLRLLVTPFNKIAVATRDLRVDVDAPVLVVSSEEIWIGNNTRVIHYKPLQKTSYDEPFHTSIKEVWAKDSAILNTTTDLPYRLNSIRVNYFSTFFENPEKTEYQYQLQGFQNNWSAWTGNTEAVFTNLPYGQYTFTVRARNLYGYISKPATFSFRIATPLYLTWWAILGYIMAGVSLVALIIQLNTRRIRKQKLILEKKVQEKIVELEHRNQEVLEQKQEIIKQAQELEALNLAKDKLFSIVSHDLRGPVKQIHVILSLMEKQHISEEEFKAFLPKFKESVEHTVNLTDNLLHWANSQMEGIQVNPTCINVSEIAEENFQLFKPLAEGKNIRLINETESDIQAYADKDMIKLVLRNLLNNAIKFTQSGESIVIGATPNHESVEVFVKDTGVGLAPEDVDAIIRKKKFSKQGTIGEKGAGIGLLLCQEFIEKNNGVLTIESRSGKGSCFAFRIPSC